MQSRDQLNTASGQYSSLSPGQLKDARSLLIASLISIALVPIIAASDKYGGLVILCFLVNFFAVIGGASMAARGLDLSSLPKVLSLALSCIPVANIVVTLVLLYKIHQALGTIGDTSLSSNQRGVSTPQAGELMPVDSPPSLTTINGCGFMLYGKSDYDEESGSYMTTHYCVVLFVPLFPIARYRVISSAGLRYRFVGKGQLRLIDKLHMLAFAALVLYSTRRAWWR